MLPSYNGITSTGLRKKIVVDLGCGNRKEEEHFFGVDIRKCPGVDVIADLDNNFPFKNNSIDEFHATESLEHLKDPIHVMNEIYRCLRPYGLLHFEVPSTSGPGAFQDPTHKSFWNENSFWYYTDSCRHFYPDLIKCRFGEVDINVRTAVKYPIRGIVYVHGTLKKLPLEEEDERVSNEACGA